MESGLDKPREPGLPKTLWDEVMAALRRYRPEIEAARTMRLVVNVGREKERSNVSITLEHYCKDIAT
jgi:phage baseplate assembly protein W